MPTVTVVTRELENRERW